jgi:large subunit ribosomal protein L9
MSFTKVILTAKVANLGAEADIVRVRSGYARNYLYPRGFAMELEGSERRLNALKGQRAEREAKNSTNPRICAQDQQAQDHHGTRHRRAGKA